MKMLTIITIVLRIFVTDACKQPLDLEHKQRTEECGKVHDELNDESPMDTSNSRVSNAKESDVHYPWVVGVRREFRRNRQLLGRSKCGGAIITQR